MVMKFALNRSYPSVRNPVSATMTTRIWEDPIGALFMAAKHFFGVRYCPLLKDAEVFPSSIVDVGNTE